MKTSFLLLSTALAVAASVANAEVTIDDFSSGAFSGLLAATPASATTFAQQAGTMASGSRQWSLWARGAEGTGALVDISPRGLELRSNTGVVHRTDWVWGETYDGHDHPMDLDLSGESVLRFAFADVPRGLNFNVQLYYDHRIDNYSQLGINITPHEGPVNIDFSLADFVAHVADPAIGADLSHVTGLHMITQSGGYVGTGGEGFRLLSISAVPEPGPAWTMAAGLLALAGMARRRSGDAGRASR